jgi:amino acid adenylation domain-containing protein
MEKVFNEVRTAVHAPPLTTEGFTGISPQLNALIASLPAGRTAVGRPSKARAVMPAAETERAKSAATALNVSLREFLLGGFAALLSHLATQDVISVLQITPPPSVVTFRFSGEESFGVCLRGVEVHQVSSETVPAPGVTYEYLQTDEVPSQQGDLALVVRSQLPTLDVELVSYLGIWDDQELERWLFYLRGLWNSAAEDPGKPVKYLPLLDQASTHAFYKSLNNTAVDFPLDTCVPELISRRAAQTPEATAVVHGRKRYSYAQLEEQSSKLAQLLVEMGAGPGRPVAICMERSADMPMALLAVLKAGSCYVPLDPQHPRKRLLSILEECKAIAVLSSSVVALTLRLDSTLLLCVDQPWPESRSKPQLHALDPHTLAYIIYTSGTTGRPKGVMIAHRSLTNTLCAMQREPGFSPSDRMLALATISFDMSVLDMFLPLVSGGTVVVAERHAASDPERLAKLLETHDITVLQTTPVTWRLLASSGWRGKRDLKMLSGGEALPRQLAEQLLQLGGDLWNCYGPTETTVYSSNLRIGNGDGIVHVAPPMANTTFYVIDDAGNLLPQGVAGELYIGGAGVSRGYLERPELNKERFVADPFEPSEKIFRTGDLARIVDRGELELFGRRDHQVKLRGYRIELGEIESVMRTHHAVSNAVVVLREDVADEPMLVAYLTLREGTSEESVDVRGHAAQVLPDYMLPQRIVILQQMPLTPSGKIDRKVLPAPGKVATRSRGVEAASELERKLLTVFHEVLGENSMGVTDSFFEFGGYSLLTVKLFARIKREMGVELPISVLFDAPTVRALAHLIEEDTAPSLLVPIRPRGKTAPLFIIHSYLIYGALSLALEEDRPIYGLREVERKGEIHSLQQRADLYAKAIAEVNPDGPLNLAGWCAAGSLTVEVARRLSENGHQIGALMLFDSERPGYQEQFFRQVSWRARFAASWSFHPSRFKGISLRDKISYVAGAFRRQWERIIESLSTRQRTRVLWLQRHFPFLIPAALLDNDTVSITFPADYAWQPYTGKILLIRASEEPQFPGMDQSLGWNKIATQPVRVEFVPGDHESMFEEPHLETFARKLQEALRESDPAPSLSIQIPSTPNL